MERIPSFAKDHNVLTPGFYVSNTQGSIITYDMRFKKPNSGDYLGIAAMHSIEHLFATVIRNSDKEKKVVYFGPMGCRTGFYLLLLDTDYDEAKRLTIDCLEECLRLETIPGRKKIECGNYRSHSLSGAKKELAEYLKVLKA